MEQVTEPLKATHWDDTWWYIIYSNDFKETFLLYKINEWDGTLITENINNINSHLPY